MASANLGAACSVSLKCTHSLLKRFFTGFDKEVEKNHSLKPERFEEFDEACRSPVIKVVYSNPVFGIPDPT